MIRINLLCNETDLLKRAFYRWYTVSAGREHVKIGPVSVFWYRWFDRRVRVGVSVLFGPERILFGGPLA